MAASGHLCPAPNMVRPLAPLAGWTGDVLGKQDHTRRGRDRVVFAHHPQGALVLPIHPGGGADRLRHPVERYDGQQVVLGESRFHVAVAVAPGAVFLYNPGGESRGGVIKPVGQSLGLGALEMGVAALFLLPVRPLVDERLLGRGEGRGIRS
jgi:hypothetical protein